MDENQQQKSIGPALAVVIVVGIVAIAGIFLYKVMVKDIMKDSGATTVAGDEWSETQSGDTTVSPANSDLSTSTDIDAIAADLDTTETELDTSFIEELDAELLDFEDLEDLDLSM